MKVNHIKNIIKILGLGCCLAFVSCTSEEPVARNGEIIFNASVRGSTEIDTRAIEMVPVSLSTYGDEIFYINSQIENGPQNLSEYQVAPGHNGQLGPVDVTNSLLWRDKNSNHVFYGWTMPWQKDTYQIGQSTQSTIHFTQDYYKDLDLKLEEYYNCRILEKFIGAKTNELNYLTNGEMVQMNYQHLVSKMHINPIQLVNNDGSSAENVNATMTFYQMPRTAIFDRHPEDGTTPPKVYQDADAQKGITCNVGNYVTTLYICPEIDFSNMQFSIHFEQGEAKGDYYGDFKSVIFQREDTDQPEWDKGKSPTVLYAGEEMTINFTIRGGNVGGISVRIRDWNTRPQEYATGHARKGLYTDGELLSMYTYFNGNYDEETFEQFFDMYGTLEEGENGETEKVIYMYEDCVISHTRMPVPREAILDGTGHTVTIRNSSETEAHVGCCRNIYITNGTSTIYIDEDFNIFLVDQDTMELTPTEYKLEPVPLTGNYYSYYINFKTGAVRPSTQH